MIRPASLELENDESLSRFLFFFLGHLFGRSVSNKGLLVRGALK